MSVIFSRMIGMEAKIYISVKLFLNSGSFSLSFMILLMQDEAWPDIRQNLCI